LSGKKVIAISARKPKITNRKVTLGTTSATVKPGARKQLTQRERLVPAARKQLCFVQQSLTRGTSPNNDGFGEGCIGRRYAERHGLQLGVSTTTFNAVLPEHTTPVQVTFTDGSSIQLYANASGVITHNFTKPARLISYTGPTGLQIHLKRCAPHEQQPCLTNGSSPAG
jgi:hypothetical protein